MIPYRHVGLGRGRRFGVHQHRLLHSFVEARRSLREEAPLDAACFPPRARSALLRRLLRAALRPTRIASIQEHLARRRRARGPRRWEPQLKRSGLPAERESQERGLAGSGRVSKGLGIGIGPCRTVPRAPNAAASSPRRRHFAQLRGRWGPQSPVKHRERRAEGSKTRVPRPRGRSPRFVFVAQGPVDSLSVGHS